MPIKLYMANIVILANTHNPSILSAEWLSKQEILKDGMVVMHAPQVSVVRSKAIEMTADPTRVQFTALETDEAGLKNCFRSAKRYMEILEHVPYTALGFNLHFLLDPTDNPEIKVLCNTDSMETIIGLRLDKQGFLSIWHSGSAQCRLLFDPSTPRGRELQFNDHFDLKENGSLWKEISEKDFWEFYCVSLKVAEKIC